MEEVKKLVCRKTLIHINKGNPLFARESKGNPPTRLISQHSILLFFLQKNKTNSENPISIRKDCVKLQAIKEIQISRLMTIYGQTLGVFKRKNNECIRNGEKTKLHKIKIEVF